MFVNRIPLLLVVILVLAPLLCQSQSTGSDSPYLMRIERQTHEENVCMLVQKDGHFRLERIIIGRTRVFEDNLDSSAINELEPLLSPDQLLNLKQSQIEMTLVGEDMDAAIVAIARPVG